MDGVRDGERLTRRVMVGLWFSGASPEDVRAISLVLVKQVPESCDSDVVGREVVVVGSEPAAKCTEEQLELHRTTLLQGVGAVRSPQIVPSINCALVGLDGNQTAHAVSGLSLRRPDGGHVPADAVPRRLSSGTA